MADDARTPGPIRPYGTAIHNCIAEGDLQKMKRLSAETETYVAELSDALKALQAEIAKAAG